MNLIVIQLKNISSSREYTSLEDLLNNPNLQSETILHDSLSPINKDKRDTFDITIKGTKEDLKNALHAYLELILNSIDKGELSNDYIWEELGEDIQLIQLVLRTVGCESFLDQINRFIEFLNDHLERGEELYRILVKDARNILIRLYIR
jgi:hypothetical protein